MTVLLRNCAYVVRSPTQIDRDCDLLVEDEFISAIGKDFSVPDGADVLEANECVVIPGLINAHTHLYQNFIKGISGGVSLVPWCNEVLFPTVGALRVGMKSNHRAAYLWTALSAIEMIRGGVTSCIDMDVISPEIPRAWNDIGFRGVVAYTLSNKWVPEELRSSEGAMKQQMLDFVDEFHRPDGLTTVFVAPSTLFLCTDDFLRWAGEQARQLNLGIQIHIAEISSEVTDLLAETGHRPVEHLEFLGLLDERLSAVHCVHLDQHEMELLAKSGACVVHCPKSNMKLADGIAPVVQMRKMGIPLSVATDGCASNDLLDMWEEMRVAVLLARVSQSDAAALMPQDVFRMATVDAAKAARLNAGELQPGKLADLAVLDLKNVHIRPFHADDLLNMLVFCAKTSDVRHTMIHGKWVMRERHITRMDETALIREAEEIEAPLYRMRSDPQILSN